MFRKPKKLTSREIVRLVVLVVVAIGAAHTFMAFPFPLGKYIGRFIGTLIMSVTGSTIAILTLDR